MFSGPGYSNKDSQIVYTNGMPSSSPGMQPPSVAIDQQKAMFRYGETTFWSSQFFQGGSTLANSANNRLFSANQGSSGQGFTDMLSVAETNLRTGGQLPQATSFDCYGIALNVIQYDNQVCAGHYGSVPAVTNADISNLVNVQNNMVLQWDFTMSQVWISPATLVGAGGGAFGAISTTQDATDRGAMNNGNGSYWIYNMYPVALPGLTSFALLLLFGVHAAPVGANGMALRVVLLGYYKNFIEIG